MCKQDRLQNAGIITAVEYSVWAAPIVVVREASRAVRVYGDYLTALNNSLQPHQYPLPIPQDMFVGLANCKVFSLIDLSDACLQVEQRIQGYGFTIKAEKCSFGQRQIKYLSHIIDGHGLQATKDVSGLRSFLGAINWCGKFVPSMRMLRYPLDELFKSSNKFVWTAECQESFQKFKEIQASNHRIVNWDQIP